MSALVSSTPLRQVTTVKEMLANKHAADQLAAVAASHLNPERMMRTLALAISKTPLLGECTPMSLLGAMMTSSSLGLEANTVMGHSYLVPFRNNRAKTVEAQLIVGYRGYLFLAANAGVAINTGIHFSDDPVWNYEEGSDRALRHVPGVETGEFEHAYAVAAGQNGFKTWVVWSEARLIAHRDRYSKGYAADIKQGKTASSPNANIWIVNPRLAREKTMVRVIQKMVPQARDMAYAAALDGVRADYATFAMNPSLGIPAPDVDDEGTSEIDAETGEVIDDAPKQVENKPAVVAEKVQTPAKEPVRAASATAENPMAAARARAQAAAARKEQVTEQEAPATAETTAAPAAEEISTEPEADAPNFAGMYQKIMDDVFAVDAAEAFVALEVWEDQLAEWAERDPDSHRMLMDAVADREASGKKAGER